MRLYWNLILKEIPSANIFLDVNINFAADGKIELSLNNKHNIGFEIKDNKARLISDHERDYDFIVEANLKTGLNFKIGLDAIKQQLMDVSIDGGIKASANTIIHLYDEKGNKEETTSNLSYSVVNEIAKENKDVKVCSNINLNWYSDILINSNDTLLNKYGLSKKISLIDKNINLNKNHLENGHLMAKCTREERIENNIIKEEFNSDQILLSKSSLIIKAQEKYKIEYKYLPIGYNKNDFIMETENPIVAITNDGYVYAKTKGNTRILIKTKDNKYSTYLNVLVTE